VAYPLLYGGSDICTPPPLRIPPIYDILTGKKGVQWRKSNIRKKILEKFLGKNWNYFPLLLNGGIFITI